MLLVVVDAVKPVLQGNGLLILSIAGSDGEEVLLTFRSAEQVRQMIKEFNGLLELRQDWHAAQQPKDAG